MSREPMDCLRLARGTKDYRNIAMFLDELYPNAAALTDQFTLTQSDVAAANKGCPDDLSAPESALSQLRQPEPNANWISSGKARVFSDLVQNDVNNFFKGQADDVYKKLLKAAELALERSRRYVGG
jgi:hypothetical protein